MINCTRPSCRCENDPEWWVKSPEHGNCFFAYMADNPREHTLDEVAELLEMTIPSVSASERKAVIKLRKLVNRHLILLK
jgi:hypothetical protein